MRTNCLLLLLTCTFVLAVPAGAQTDAVGGSVKNGHQLSPALLKKVAARTAALRANAADAVGPMFDRLSRGWTIETADCSLVKSQVKLTGSKGHTVWVTMNDDGSFHIQIRTEASGTAADAGGNNYIWIYNAVADLDTPDPNADVPIVTGSSPGTFQLIPITTGGASYTAVQYLKVDTPTPLNANLTGVSNVPLGCEPI